MAVPDRLVEVWAAGAGGRGKCSSGWVVGQDGVLSCRHVLERYLASTPGSAAGADEPVIQVRSAGASSRGAWVDCTLAWQHPDRDVALLRITPGPGQSWTAPAGRSPHLAATGEHPSECQAVGFPDAEARPEGLRVSEQVSGQLLPGGGARDPDGLIPFDAGSSVPDDARLWAGISGSAVTDRHGRLVGLVVRAHPQRQQRRLLVVPLADAAEDPAFAAAAAAVGLDPVLEDVAAPVWRRSVEPRALTPAGVPLAVDDIADLAVFGVHGSAAAAHGPYVSYVPRNRDPDLRAALASARSGGPRVVLVVGDSAAGKSRSTAEALRQDRVLRGWRLIVPFTDGGLSRLADAGLGWANSLLWLDDLDKYLARLDLGTLQRVLAEDPAVVVVATMRASQLQARQEQLADPAWSFLTDEAQVKRVYLEASFNDDELAAASSGIEDPALLNALQEGVGLGEWLMAGPELIKRLAGERDLNRGFADTVIAWFRTGLAQPLGPEDARRLWASSLSPALRARLLSREPGEQDQLFEQASSWACQPVFSRALIDQALITKTAGKYAAHDYVVDQIVRDPGHPPVADAIWDYALQTATGNPDPEQRTSLVWAVGMAGFREEAHAPALAAMRLLAEEGDVSAWINTGILLGETGQAEAELEVYDEVIAHLDGTERPALRRQLARALVNKGTALAGLGRQEEAAGVFGDAVVRFGADTDEGLNDVVARAIFRKGIALGRLGQTEAEIAAYHEAAVRYREADPTLRFQIVAGLMGQAIEHVRGGRREAGIAAYDEVITHFGTAAEPRLREAVALALFNRGTTLWELERLDEAVATFDMLAARFGSAEETTVGRYVSEGLGNRAIILGKLGQRDAEMRAYDEIVTRFAKAGTAELRRQAALALYNKAVSLNEMGHPEAAIQAYREVVTRFGADGTLSENVAEALLNQGITLGELGQPDAEMAVYDDLAARFGGADEPVLRDRVATALLYKGITLEQLERLEQAVEVYDRVVRDFGTDTEPGPRQRAARALVYQGNLLRDLGRPDAAIAAYDEVTARFGAAPEPELRKLVDLAGQMKAALRA